MLFAARNLGQSHEDRSPILSDLMASTQAQYNLNLSLGTTNVESLVNMSPGQFRFELFQPGYSSVFNFDRTLAANAFYSQRVNSTIPIRAVSGMDLTFVPYDGTSKRMFGMMPATVYPSYLNE